MEKVAICLNRKNKICVGDIFAWRVRGKEGNELLIGEVYYDEDNFCYWVGTPGEKGFDINYVIKYGEKIGNIFDNPNLIYKKQ